MSRRLSSHQIARFRAARTDAKRLVSVNYRIASPGADCCAVCVHWIMHGHGDIGLCFAAWAGKRVPMTREHRVCDAFEPQPKLSPKAVVPSPPPGAEGAQAPEAPSGGQGAAPPIVSSCAVDRCVSWRGGNLSPIGVVDRVACERWCGFGHANHLGKACGDFCERDDLATWGTGVL